MSHPLRHPPVRIIGSRSSGGAGLAALVVVLGAVVSACGDRLDSPSGRSSTEPGGTTIVTVGSDPGTIAVERSTPPTVSPPTVPPSTVPPPTVPTTAPVSVSGSQPSPRQDFEPGALRGELEAARQRWSKMGVGEYTLEYTVTCFCDPTTFRATAIAGRLVETTATDSGGESITDPQGSTVEQWFDRIDRAIDTAYRVDVSFDSDSGLPRELYIDEDAETADDEHGMTVVDFQRLAAPISDVVNQPYGCGYGFWTATPGQGVALRLGFDEPPGVGTFDVADLDTAELLIGSNLMANWCNDVALEPAASVRETWPITSGTLAIRIDEFIATATITGLVATTPDGEQIALGDAVISNSEWAMITG